MEEMVQVLFDQGVLARNGKVSIAKPHRIHSDTPTVKGILAGANPTSSPLPTRILLQTLSVIGKNFRWCLIAALFDKSDDELAATLEICNSESYLRATAFPESDYTFKHALTQEVAYEQYCWNAAEASTRHRRLHRRVCSRRRSKITSASSRITYSS